MVIQTVAIILIREVAGVHATIAGKRVGTTVEVAQKALLTDRLPMAIRCVDR